ncbi:ASCH domain-containing protein [Pediococcus ethanolidurans]|uniref:ASCH domain-containing protein n=1 Tax=Pediococcus ethanolidurans TaxID=319653 RepID=UPI001C1EA6E8|nr:ASCH domain-containing protein [Pediococcus ethanolidurans]MBU7563138.1 ASCH domain-containing protein [Pediococcus ethanolidurans]MCT4398612.1 ASCH domain-containing protein [Pediococcus ethanolidurans]MCV3324360.1 ASCH domain-containing protein [Pediococcus ethanolidurans]MCV3327289.1 ASCH domain-containing protein [Pediococcus ethanolidurans]MCV3554783.1 ASCH domain-containing protein [Pediococcus ethanolidurans]
MATSSEKIWTDFSESHHLTNKTFQTRWFGEQSNSAEVQDLTNKILAGDKISTSKPLGYYSSEGEQIPQVGDYYVLLNADMHPVGIIETVVSELVPFFRVSAEHAYNEAEGDRTLSDWQERSQTKFTKQMKKYDRTFSTNDPIVCEVIKLVYKAQL